MSSSRSASHTTHAWPAGQKALRRKSSRGRSRRSGGSGGAWGGRRSPERPPPVGGEVPQNREREPGGNSRVAAEATVFVQWDQHQGDQDLLEREAYEGKNQKPGVLVRHPMCSLVSKSPAFVQKERHHARNEERDGL